MEEIQYWTGSNSNDREAINKREKQAGNEPLSLYYTQMWTRYLGGCGKAVQTGRTAHENPG